MKQQYDAIIIGGGHNGLVAAAYLAQAGKSVLVLEKRELLGGAAATEELFPGFRANTGAENAGNFHPQIQRELFLKMHGLTLRQPAAAIFVPAADRPLTLYPDVQRTTEMLAAYGLPDAERYPVFAAHVAQMTDVLREMLLQTPPDLAGRNVNELLSWGRVGWKLKRIGDKAMMEFLRVLPMPAREWLDEWFESDLLKGALGMDAVAGSAQGPRAAGTTLQFLYQHMHGFLQAQQVLGGTGALSQALADAAAAYGAEVRTGTAVTAIQLDENGRAIAVILENGDQIPARTILSSVDPRQTLFEFVGPHHLPPRFMRAVRSIIYRGTTAKLILALSALPSFHGQPETAQLSGRIRLAPSLDAIERAYDDSKYGRYSAKPVLDMQIPTILDPGLAPAGQHLLQITVRYTPFRLREESWDEAAAGLETAVLAQLRTVAPQIDELIRHKKLLTPMRLRADLWPHRRLNLPWADGAGPAAGDAPRLRLGTVPHAGAQSAALRRGHASRRRPHRRAGRECGAGAVGVVVKWEVRSTKN
jgi:phytoene dehydrogenase-like protein